MLFMEDFVFSIVEKIGHGGKVRPSPELPDAQELWNLSEVTSLQLRFYLSCFKNS